MEGTLKASVAADAAGGYEGDAAGDAEAVAPEGAAGDVPEGASGGAGFFQNRECPHFPCHHIDDPRLFNCLFCFCPLYALGEGCGGDFAYTEQGVKDCSGCALPHRGDGGNRLVERRFSQIARLAARTDAHETGTGA